MANDLPRLEMRWNAFIDQQYSQNKDLDSKLKFFEKISPYQASSYQDDDKNHNNKTRKTAMKPNKKIKLKQKTKIKKPLNQNRAIDTYQKNIFGYIMKIAIKQSFTSQFEDKINILCKKYGSFKEDYKKFYQDKIDKVTGPSHLHILIDDFQPKDQPIICIFLEFILWYLRQRYLRYLLTHGRMNNKQIYIKKKNQKIITLLRQNMKKFNKIDLLV